MIVRFESSETGEVLMFAETARVLLQIIGKETSARGVFTQPEMAPAVTRLRQAVAEANRAAAGELDDDADEEKKPLEPIISLSQRAWPLIDMLERTAAAGPEEHIVWEAREAF